MKSFSIKELCERGMLRFDVEFGNADSYFSGIRSIPYLYAEPHLESSSTCRAWIDGAELALSDIRELAGEQAFSRRVDYSILSESRLYDVVSRFVVIDSGVGRFARINGREIPHVNSNIYYQYPAGRVRVPVGDRLWLDFTGHEQGMPPEIFEHVFYVRDERQVPEGNVWIVHHRIIATLRAQRLVVRGCNPRFEGPLPRWANALIPRSLRRQLFRIRETRYPNFPFMTVGENVLVSGHRFSLTTRIECHE